MSQSSLANLPVQSVHNRTLYCTVCQDVCAQSAFRKWGAGLRGSDPEVSALGPPRPKTKGIILTCIHTWHIFGINAKYDCSLSIPRFWPSPGLEGHGRGIVAGWGINS